MKSTYSSNHPLMKMAPLDLVSSRPQHESRKPEAVVATVISMEKGALESKGFKKKLIG